MPAISTVNDLPAHAVFLTKQDLHALMSAAFPPGQDTVPEQLERTRQRLAEDYYLISDAWKVCYEQIRLCWDQANMLFDDIHVRIGQLSDIGIRVSKIAKKINELEDDEIKNFLISRGYSPQQDLNDIASEVFYDMVTNKHRVRTDFLLRIVKHLLAAGADINKPRWTNLDFPIRSACYSYNSVLKFLLESPDMEFYLPEDVIPARRWDPPSISALAQSKVLALILKHPKFDANKNINLNGIPDEIITFLPFAAPFLTQHNINVISYLKHALRSLSNFPLFADAFLNSVSPNFVYLTLNAISKVNINELYELLSFCLPVDESENQLDPRIETRFALFKQIFEQEIIFRSLQKIIEDGVVYSEEQEVEARYLQAFTRLKDSLNEIIKSGSPSFKACVNEINHLIYSLVSPANQVTHESLSYTHLQGLLSQKRLTKIYTAHCNLDTFLKNEIQQTDRPLIQHQFRCEFQQLLIQPAIRQNKLEMERLLELAIQNDRSTEAYLIVTQTSIDLALALRWAIQYKNVLLFRHLLLTEFKKGRLSAETVLNVLSTFIKEIYQSDLVNMLLKEDPHLLLAATYCAFEQALTVTTFSVYVAQLFSESDSPRFLIRRLDAVAKELSDMIWLLKISSYSKGNWKELPLDLIYQIGNCFFPSDATNYSIYAHVPFFAKLFSSECASPCSTQVINKASFFCDNRHDEMIYVETNNHKRARLSP